MQTYTQTFAAAQTWKMNVPGKYFVLLQCGLACNARFYLGGKKLDLGDISQLLAGLEVGPLAGLTAPNAFDTVEVDVQAGDTVQIGIGNGQARYNRANASVTVVNQPTVLLDTTTRKALIRPEAHTHSYAANSAMAANAPETIVGVGANTNGIILLSATIADATVGVVVGLTLLAKATAPANNQDGVVYLRASFLGIHATRYISRAELQSAQFVPAGLALYAIAASATDAFDTPRVVRYILL